MKKFTKDIKIKIIGLYKQGITIKEICVRYKISKATIYSWIKSNRCIFNKDKTKAIKYSDYEKLQQQISVSKEINFCQPPGKIFCWFWSIDYRRIYYSTAFHNAPPCSRTYLIALNSCSPRWFFSSRCLNFKSVVASGTWSSLKLIPINLRNA